MKRPGKETAQTPIILDEPKDVKPSDFKLVAAHMTILGPRPRAAAALLTPMQLMSIASNPDEETPSQQSNK